MKWKKAYSKCYGSVKQKSFVVLSKSAEYVYFLFYGTQGESVIMIVSIKYMAAYLQHHLSHRFIGGSQIILRPRIALCTVRTLRCWRFILQSEVKLMKKKKVFVNSTLKNNLKTTFKYTSLNNIDFSQNDFWNVLNI